MDYQFKKTTKWGTGKGSHYHIAYLRQNDGITTETLGHFHKIVLLKYDQTIPVEGSETPIMRPTEEWKLETVNDHTHSLEEIALKKEDMGTEQEAVKRVQALYKIEEEEEAASLKVARECEAFYEGDQWEKDILDKLEAKDRAALTLNELEGKMDILGGYNRQNRTDMKCFPVEEGDGRVADILTLLLKVILEKNDYPIVENQVFDDEAIVGRGIFNVYISRKENVRGDIIVENFPWDEIRMGPHNKIDGSDCEHMSKVKWYSLANIKREFPGKADDIQTGFDKLLKPGDAHQVKPGTQYKTSKNVVAEGEEAIAPEIGSDFVEIGKQNIKVVECWQKEPKQIAVLVNTRDDVYHNAKDWEKADIEAVAKLDGFGVVYRPGDRIRITKIVGNILLDDDYPDLPVDDFQTITVYAKKRKGRWWGKVKLGLDAQREMNKRHSQIADILNKMAPYGWFYDSETFFSPQEEQNFRETSSSAGFTSKVKDSTKPPVKIDGIKFPNELAAYEELAKNTMKELLNVSLESAFAQQGQQSGVAIAQRKMVGLVGNEFLFDNLSLAKRKLGKLIIKNIQHLYTPERIMRIITNRNAKTPVQIGDENWEQVNKEEIRSLLENDDLTQYDIAVAESAYSPTTRFTNFVLWSELAAKGVQVPPEILIDLSDLPDKEKVKTAISQINQQSAKMNAIKYITEMAKVLVTKGILPQNFLSEMGLLPPPAMGPGGGASAEGPQPPPQ